MKIRQGFVSNSSSSSFVIRGIKIEKNKLVKLWNISKITDKTDELYPERVLFDKLHCEANKRKLAIEDTREFFDGDPTQDVIIGAELISLGDGVVVELPEPDDKVIIKLLDKNNIKTKKLSTFIQYVSNDNY